MNEDNKILQEQNDLLKKQIEILSSLQNSVRDLSTRMAHNNRLLDHIRIHQVKDDMNKVRDFFDQRQLGLIESIRYLADNEVSLARFGDGEFYLWAYPEHNIGFQKNSEQLRNDLQATLNYAATHPDRLVLGMPQFFQIPYWGTLYSALWDQIYMNIKNISPLLNSHMTRPHAFENFKDDCVPEWRRVWAGKRVQIVTGRGSRFTLLPELFDSAKDIGVTYGAPRDAYKVIPDLVSEIKGKPVDLVLISLGPAGTVLAYELAKAGMRAIDIGHISSSYQTVHKGMGNPEIQPIVR